MLVVPLPSLPMPFDLFVFLCVTLFSFFGAFAARKRKVISPCD
jgi:hypothetical protein